MGFSGQKSKIDSTLPMWLRKMGEMGVNGVKLGEDDMSSYFTLVQPTQHMPRNASQRTSLLIGVLCTEGRTRTRTNTNPNGTEANAAGRSVRACDARKSKS